jgi:hypothetical protein
MPTFAPINDNYILDKDSSVSFESPIVDLMFPLQAVNYQLKWAENVSGRFIFEGSVYPDPYCWETIVNCEEIIVEAGPSGGSSIVSLTGVWLTLGFVRYRWDPADSGSTGNINTAIRVVPV